MFKNQSTMHMRIYLFFEECHLFIFLALFLGQICLRRSDQGQNGPDKTALRAIQAHFKSSSPVRW